MNPLSYKSYWFPPFFSFFVLTDITAAGLLGYLADITLRAAEHDADLDTYAQFYLLVVL